MGYFGLTLNVGNLVGDVFVNSFVGSLAEIPGYLILLVTIKVGRKKPFFILNLIGGAALIASAFLIVYISNPGQWILPGIQS